MTNRERFFVLTVSPSKSPLVAHTANETSPERRQVSFAIQGICTTILVKFRLAAPQMDGMDARDGIFVVAATNRPDMIDPALLRPGRLDKLLYVPLPSEEGRLNVLQALTQRTPMDTGVDLAAVAASPRCQGFSGADLAALVREACMDAMRETRAPDAAMGAPLVRQEHFAAALSRVSPSVSPRDQASYERLR